MPYVSQDLTDYFENLKKKLNSKNKDLGFKFFLIFFVISQIIAITTYSYLIRLSLAIDAEQVYFLQSCFSFLFSLIAGLIYQSSIGIKKLKNKDRINVYDGLHYLYRDERKKLNDEDFIVFIDEKYELFQEKDIIENAFHDIKNYQNKILEIKKEYRNKQRMVSATFIFNKEINSKL